MGHNGLQLYRKDELLKMFHAEEPFKIVDKDKPPESWHTRKEYGSRPFVAWDGEGITHEGNIKQSYVLFGCSLGQKVRAVSLSTQDCFDVLFDAEQYCPEAIHIGFALQYDFNMILKDLDEKQLERIYKTNVCYWNKYRIEYRPGKWLSLRRKDVSVRLFDVFGFFQTSFVNAVKKFVGEDSEEYKRVEEGKKLRQSFQYDQLKDYVIPYWEAELVLMVKLMESLRNDLQQADIEIVSWHGPGAIANSVFRKHRVKEIMDGDVPKEVNRAAQYGYAGGRFELFKAGHHPHNVWQYDIRSAYPSAIAQLPSLHNGRWVHTEEYKEAKFAIYRLHYRNKARGFREFLEPNPLFCRDKKGNVSYPSEVLGWYWSPEAALIPPENILEGWIYEYDEEERPFGWVEDIYDRRAEWKRNGNSAERALKLVLNSLYGKMAQRVGWFAEGDPIPRFHQLEWAGYVTSFTRAKLWRIIRDYPESIIATETDAIFTTERFNDILDIGEGLGQWEETEYEWITYIQNGVYWAGANGGILEKYRGFDKGSLSHVAIMDHLSTVDKPKPSPLSGVTTRFIGMGLGLHTAAEWRSWQTSSRALRFGGGGKRHHNKRLCTTCLSGQGGNHVLHDLIIGTSGGRSQPHSLPWKEGAESRLRAEDELARW